MSFLILCTDFFRFLCFFVDIFKFFYDFLAFLNDFCLSERVLVFRKFEKNVRLDGEVECRNKNLMNDLEDGFMGVDLLKHNQEAYEKVQKAISDGKN